MDPITTGIGGALLARALPEERRGPIGVWVMVGAAMFPDIDILAPLVTGDPLANYTIHRGYTHSFVGVLTLAPLLALGFLAIGRATGKDKDYKRLWGLCSLALLWHIFTDVPTTWGTIVFFPFSWQRVAWDWIFIIDLYYTGLLALPLLLGWIYTRRDPAILRGGQAAGRPPGNESRWWRVLGAWLPINGFVHAVLTFAGRALNEELPFMVYVVASAIIASVLIAPMLGGWGFRLRSETFARAGLVVFGCYVALTAVAHSVALRRVETLVERRGLEVQSVAALPQPLSPLRWAGMVLTEEGVYVSRFRLFDGGNDNAPSQKSQLRFYPSDDNEYVARAREIPSAKTYLWFARYPVARYSNSDGRHIVEFAAMRFNVGGLPDEFMRLRFGFRVVFDAEGELVSAGRPSRN